MRAFFDDVLVPGAEFVALESILAEFSMYDEDDLDLKWHYAQFMSRNRTSKKTLRVWWRVPLTSRTIWVSTNPGEVRCSPPAPPCIILDMPAGEPNPCCRTLLMEAVSRCEEVTFLTPYEYNLLDCAYSRLRVPKNVRPSLPHEIEQRIKKDFVENRTADFQQLVDRLFVECLLQYQTTLSYFSPIVALLQLQDMFDYRIVEDWLGEPLGYLYGTVAGLVKDHPQPSVVQNIAAQLCNSAFINGRRETTAALRAESMQTKTRRLMLACHYYNFARVLNVSFIKAGVELPDLAFTELLVEEAYVHTCSAMTVAVYPKQKFDRWAKEHIGTKVSSFSNARRKMRRHASEVNPSFTIFFSDILVAQAMTLSKDPDVIQEGMRVLEKLLDAAFEGALTGEEGSEDRSAELLVRAMTQYVLFEVVFIVEALLRAHRKHGQKAPEHVIDLLATALVLRTKPWQSKYRGGLPIRLAAERNDVEAQSELGLMYERGHGAAHDDVQAVQWFRKAAEQGHGEAQVNLGFMYAAGRGVPQDEAQAVQWFRKAAEQRDPAVRRKLRKRLKELEEAGYPVSDDSLEHQQARVAISVPYSEGSIEKISYELDDENLHLRVVPEGANLRFELQDIVISDADLPSLSDDALQQILCRPPRKVALLILSFPHDGGLREVKHQQSGNYLHILLEGFAAAPRRSEVSVVAYVAQPAVPLDSVLPDEAGGMARKIDAAALAARVQRARLKAICANKRKDKCSKIREALGEFVTHGQRGTNGFYVIFRTDHPRVEIPDHLLSKYPRQMAIMIQYEFSDLSIEQDGFGIRLSFGENRYHLYVPFSAIMAFMDERLFLDYCS